MSKKTNIKEFKLLNIEEVDFLDKTIKIKRYLN